MVAGDVSAAHRSQPEFDFDDDETVEAEASITPLAAVEAAPIVAAPVAVAASIAEPLDAAQSSMAPVAPEAIAQEQPEIVDAEAAVTPSPVETTGQAAFALEPAIVAPAETAVVGLPETVDTMRDADASPGLFDTAQVGTVAAVDPVEAAANAIAHHADAEALHGDNERSA